MRIITKTRIRNAMFEYPQWKAGLELWCQVFEQKSLKAGSYSLLKKTWKEASGWNTDRIPGRRLKNEQGDYGTVFDLYVFDVHGTDCRILAKLGSGTLFVRGVFSHAEYDKWCKQNIHQGKLKR